LSNSTLLATPNEVDNPSKRKQSRYTDILNLLEFE
jgi:hypothetical protein